MLLHRLQLLDLALQQTAGSTVRHAERFFLTRAPACSFLVLSLLPFLYLHGRYFREVGQIARLQTRLQTFHYKLVYEDKVKEVTDGIAKLNAAVDSICDSAVFKRLLEVVLTFGNFLNQGSFRGNAQGVKINFLNEMKGTKVSTSTSASLALSQDSSADHSIETAWH